MSHFILNGTSKRAKERAKDEAVGEVSPPPVTNKTSELLKQLIGIGKQQTNLLKSLAGIETIEPLVTIEPATVNRYKTFIFDLGVARDNVESGIRALGVVAKFIMWDKVEAPLTYRINSKGHDELVATIGDIHTDWDVEEVYITNTVSAGKEAVLYIEWRI